MRKKALKVGVIVSAGKKPLLTERGTSSRSPRLNNFFANGPSRHLVRRSDLVALGEKRTSRDHLKSVACDP
jgi:hypothetical protein